MASYFDGRTAGAHVAKVQCEDELLKILGDFQEQTWLIGKCEFVKSSAQGVSIISDRGELVLSHDEWEILLSQNPILRNKLGPDVNVHLAVGLAVSGFLLVILSLVAIRKSARPLSQMISVEKEQSFFTSEYIEKTERNRNLNKLLELLKFPHKISIAVSSIPETNAFTFPGAKVVITKDLICSSESAEELMGVIAHELGHVENRHILKAIFSDFSTNVLVETVTGGGLTGSLTSAVLINHFSVEDEREADSYAAQQLLKAQINPIKAVDFFERIKKEKGSDYLKFLSSHPSVDERIRFFRSQAKAFDAKSIEADLRKTSWTNLRADLECKKTK